VGEGGGEGRLGDEGGDAAEAEGEDDGADDGDEDGEEPLEVRHGQDVPVAHRAALVQYYIYIYNV
jgi:cobalamin biosynthesis protein CobT